MHDFRLSIKKRIWWLTIGQALGTCGYRSLIDRPKLISGLQHIFLANHVFIRWDSRIEVIGAGVLTIGEGTLIENNCHISCAGSIRIGRHVLIAPYVTLVDNDHGVKMRDVPIILQPLTIGRIVIGDGTWLGAGVRILKNVEIGEHCVIGAGAVVTKNVPSFSVVAGSPAKVIGHLPCET